MSFNNELGGDTTSVTAFSFTAGIMQNMANYVFLLPMCTFTYVSLGIDEHRHLKGVTPRQIAVDWESNIFYYYDFTTTQNS